MRPDSPAEANDIRAGFLRFLALGGDSTSLVPESGLKVQGAYIDGAVNLDSVSMVRPLWLMDCTIPGALSFSDTEIKAFSLDGSFVTAIQGDRVSIGGSLLLRRSVVGVASFAGARVGADIDCRGAQFQGAGSGDTGALRLTRIQVGGNIYLSEGFESKGEVQLNNAAVQGNIDCRGGTFTLPDEGLAVIRGPDAVSENAISLANAVVQGALILASINRQDQPSAVINGSLDLTDAYVRLLADNPVSWPPRHSSGLRNVIHLDGFTYERFAGPTPVDAAILMAWLRRQPPSHLGSDFKPQPFEQVIKVLRNMGHPEEARKLAIKREGFLTRRRFANWWRGPSEILVALSALLWAITGGLLIGHGYRPMRVLFIMAAVGLSCGFYFKLAADQGAFAPRDPNVILYDGFKDCRPEAGGNWTACTDKVGKKFAEFPQFNPWVYSFDVLLPLVDLQQEKAWAPMQQEVAISVGGYSLNVPPWGINALVLEELVFGWVASLLAVAAFSGLVKTD